MPQPRKGDGPWGEAINYWLDKRQWLQADLARATGIKPKTISSIVRGFHTQTRKLAHIAAALKVPLDTVLVSPERRLANEDRKRLAQEIAETVLRDMESRAQTGTAQSIPDALTALERSTELEETRQQRPPRTVPKPTSHKKPAPPRRRKSS